MKFRFILLLCLSLIVSVLPASASQQIVSVPNQLPVAQVWASVPGMTMQQITTVTDGDPATAWNAAAGGIENTTGAYLMLSLDSPTTISDIWIRSGDHTDAQAHSLGGYPTQITVHLWCRADNGGNVHAAQHSYELYTVYLPNNYTNDFYGGYQRLRLPAAQNNVISVVINIDKLQHVAGYDAVMISDIALCGAPTYPIVTVSPTPEPVTGAVSATLNQKMATRTGPGTKYTEPGTFLAAGDTVQVISLAYDHNDIPWVQVDFTAYGGHRRAYTGLKRLDISADEIPLEQPLNTPVTVRQSVSPRHGPGYGYVRHQDITLQVGESATVICREDGWVMLEIARTGEPLMRVWVEESVIGW